MCIRDRGYCSTGKQSYVMVDIPGTYSLMAHSTEEEVARNFICFGGPDAVVVVCDATCLERNLNLVLQTIEISSRVVVCVNLMDEAKRKNIRLDLPLISKRLGVPVVGATARKKKTLDEMMNALDGVVSGEIKTSPLTVVYPDVYKRQACIPGSDSAGAGRHRENRGEPGRPKKTGALYEGLPCTRGGEPVLSLQRQKLYASGTGAF